MGVKNDFDRLYEFLKIYQSTILPAGMELKLVKTLW